MELPKAILVDRDGTINLSSPDPNSPIYYITDIDNLILKPNVKEVFNLIKIHNIPTYLVTKQKALSKGLMNNNELTLIHVRLQRFLNFVFTGILIEPEADNKKALYENIIEKYQIPQHLALFDDSETERNIAARLGINTYDGADFYNQVCKVLHVK